METPVRHPTFGLQLIYTIRKEDKTMKTKVCTKLHAPSLGFAFGILWGASLILLALLVMFWGWGTPLLDLFGSVYIGYKATFTGILLGAAWGFVDGFISGVVIAWLYNCCLWCWCKKCNVKQEE